MTSKQCRSQRVCSSTAVGRQREREVVACSARGRASVELPAGNLTRPVSPVNMSFPRGEMNEYESINKDKLSLQVPRIKTETCLLQSSTDCYVRCYRCSCFFLHSHTQKHMNVCLCPKLDEVTRAENCNCRRRVVACCHHSKNQMSLPF